MHRMLALAFAIALFSQSSLFGQTREQKVLADREKVQAEGFWIYNDFGKGLAEAKKTGKPLLIVLRCIPCEECVKLDDDLIDQDPHVKPLLQKFVCVRLVSTNGLDLSLFQYDYDQSFAALMMNADRTIYGRFGTRSDRIEWKGDVSIEGLAKALSAALEFHKDYPRNRALFTAKTGPNPDVPSPENYPLLRGKYGASLNYERNVVQSCIHCHQVGDAQRQMVRDSKKPFSEQILFSYPHPKSQGLILDPEEIATVIDVVPDTTAALAGFMKGDRILQLDHQRLLSIADVQWVLHHTPADGDTIEAEVLRDSSKVRLKWSLPKNWRQKDDISWRATTWGLRRMATGGMKLTPATEAERQAAGLGVEGMALRALHVGQYGPHAAAKRAGILKDDIIISFDGQTGFDRETDLIAYSLRHHQAGDQVPVTVVRNGKRLNFTLPIQN